jgi:hypothetical protein
MKTFYALLLAALFALPTGVQACAVCGGSDDLKIVYAANTVLWALLALVAFIFVATGSTVYYLWKKSQAHSSTPELTH